jgi:predicted dehydrogenase
MRVVTTPAGGYDADQSRHPAPAADLWRSDDGESPYLSEVRDFADAVLTSRPPAIDGEAGLRVQRVLEACYRSAAFGKSVPV